MAIREFCGNTQPHMWHPWQAEEIVVCEGKTACGLPVHAQHEITVPTSKYCNGVCPCPELPPHGPGRHK